MKKSRQPLASPLYPNDRQSALALIGLFSVMVVGIWSMTRQWDKPLLDMFTFRQTQTAMSAYYMAKDPGIFFNYITPVLGKPWELPLELPIYQWIVARWHNFSGMGLDQSGKLVSIVFWVACLWPIWRLLGLLGFSHPQRCITGAVVYSSPLYLYWGRAFLIETTGLFLSLGMVACVVAGYKQRDWRWLLASLAFGISAALCKVTTWALAVGVAGLLILFAQGLPRRRDWGWIAGACIAAILPILPAKLWLVYGDSVKQQNPFAKELLLSSTAKQREWIFGTLHQKLDPAVWEYIWRHITEQLLVPFLVLGPILAPLVLVVGVIAFRKRIPLILIFLAGFASGPLIFTNLYYVHSYYWCANGIWLLLAAGTALAGIWEFRPGRLWPQVLTGALLLCIVISGFVTWHRRFLPILEMVPERLLFESAWFKPIQRMVPPSKTVIILGKDWEPTALYYAERKGIMVPSTNTSPIPTLLQSVKLLSPEEAIGAVCIHRSLMTPENQEVLARLLNELGMSTNGQPSLFGILYLPRQREAEGLQK
ncbi:MAG: glycosyltransferase family 39 protein [Phycisphaerae bacterium]|jgi:hypothetical protein